MTYTLAFTGRAADDIVNAFEWYEVRRSGLGAEYLTALNRTLDLVQHMPTAGPEIQPGVRRLLLKNFPYAIYYSIGVQTVEILGCLHQRRLR